MKLRTRFTLLIIMAAIGATIAVMIADQIRFNSTEEDLNGLAIRNQRVMWEQIVANHTEQLIQKRSGFTRDTALLESLRDADHDLLAHLMNGMLEANQDSVFTGAQLTDLEGNLVYSSDESEPLFDSSMVISVIESQAEVTDLTVDANGHPAVVHAFPLFDINRRNAFVGVGLLKSDLAAALKTFSDANEATSYLVTPKGAVYPSANTKLHRSLAISLPALGGEATLTSHIDDAVYRVNVLSINSNNDLPLSFLVTSRDATELAAHQTKVLYTSIAVLTAGLLLIILIISLSLKKAFRPIEELTATVEQLGKGNTSARVEIESDDEIGKLGKVFNKMAQRVEDLLDNERQTAEDLAGKVELIEEVVDMAAKGDLTGQLMVYRDQDVISELANGIQAMMDSLNSLVASIQRSGIQVTSSATEIAATAKQQEATVSEQAATTNQIRATVTEISATSKELVNTMNEVTEVALQTADKANSGRSSLEKMGETMQHMMEATSNINSKLAVLSEKAANINTVVTTINKVADQTNLLSLNAAIEAEKAGEYGVGFAVVATEIRRLADQTAVATWDIEQMVKEMQSAVSAGVMGMEKFSTEVRQGVDEVREVGVQLGQIIEQVENLIPRFEDVHEGMQSQSLGAQQISDAMIQLAESSQQTADSLRQSNGAIQQLNDAARGLQTGVSHFKVNSDDD